VAKLACEALPSSGWLGPELIITGVMATWASSRGAVMELPSPRVGEPSR
jgi:hypothetical protein